MTLSEYQILSNRTLNILPNEGMNLSHMVLGIFSEHGEYLKAAHNLDFTNIKEELGDMLWFISNYCTLRNLKFDSLHTNIIQVKDWVEFSYMDPFILSVSQLQDFVKGYLAYGKPIDPTQEMKYLTILYHNVFEKIEAYGFKLSECLIANINKLRIRFPDKYSDDNALNRDLDKERTELEK